MANVENTVTKLKSDVFFAKIDLEKGYRQIPIQTECRQRENYWILKGKNGRTELESGITHLSNWQNLRMLGMYYIKIVTL